MALEAVDLDRCVLVAGGAKIFGVPGAHNFTVFYWLGMAIDASSQAVFFCSNPINNCCIALLQQELHVVAAQLSKKQCCRAQRTPMRWQHCFLESCVANCMLALGRVEYPD